MLKQIFAKIVTFFMLVFCVGPAWGLVLKVSRPGTDTPLEIALHDTKRTEHALAVKMADGTIYYADMKPVDASFAGAAFTRIGTQIYQIGAAPVPPEFFITTTPTTSSFSFKMSAMGNFAVDWGDGNTEPITRTDTTAATYSHTYAAAGKYTITITGKATGYSTVTTTAAISFSSNKNIASVDGSLGAVFGTIGDGTGSGQQPRFYDTFDGNTNLTSIPGTLFAGVTGPVVGYMFDGTFSFCSSLESIPVGLFSTITGPAAQYMFKNTFNGCSGLSSIPAGLFSTITGPVASYMFQNTFKDCSSLTSLPENLFGDLSGSAAAYMFNGTFYGCSSLTSLPENLFGDMHGSAAPYMFKQTFYGCTNLSGPSARTTSGKYLYEIWPKATSTNVGQCYRNDTGLDDYDSIPSAWK